MADTANSNEQAAAGGKPPAARPQKPAAVFLDRSRDFSTVHGERAPGDPHHAVCSVQDGLPFDSQDKLLIDHPDANTEKAKIAVKRLLDRARKRAEREAAKLAEEEPEEDEELDAEDDGGVIDLKAWAMGQKQYRWQLVSDAIVLKFGKRITAKRDALETLVANGIVQTGQISPELRKTMNQL
jgi:hypothetical protein